MHITARQFVEAKLAASALSSVLYVAQERCSTRVKGNVYVVK